MMMMNSADVLETLQDIHVFAACCSYELICEIFNNDIAFDFQ